MSFAQVLNTLVHVSTLCCPSIDITPDVANILEYIPSPVPSDTVFQVSLNAKPKTTINVSIAIVPMLSQLGSNLNGGVTPNAAVYPKFFTFSAISPSLQGNFIVRGTPGSYLLTANATGKQSIDNFAASFKILSSNTPPSPPKLASAVFSTDGLQVYVNFATATDKGAAAKVPFPYTRSFPCSAVLSFPGDSAAACIWQSNTQIVGNLLANVTAQSASLQVGDSLTLLNNTIKAACKSGQVCPYTASATVTVSAPASAVKPTVALSVPAFVGLDDDLVLDATGCTGEPRSGLIDYFVGLMQPPVSSIMISVIALSV